MTPTRLRTLDPLRLLAPRPLGAALALCLALTPPITPARAQSSPSRAQSQKTAAAPRAESQDEEVIRVNTNLVRVDVVVTDERGRQVVDLKATDFESVEGGKVRAPEFFSYVSAGGAQG
ncbi:MAG: hypothetical protein LC785_17085 [Acidobacteria bacterium]|nr:hypothetical protein [Acidobacteriota bacterium]MCA1643611.1 hypothetical protein [Acidobacteriota bacterium]